MICRHCRDYIPEDSRFCPKCGVRLATPIAPDRPWFWILTLFLFAVIWATLVHKEFQVQFLDLRAQIGRALDVL
jgi:hypothetical protein